MTKNKTYSKLSYLTNFASSTNYIIYFSDVLFGLKYVQNRMYIYAYVRFNTRFDILSGVFRMVV